MGKLSRTELTRVRVKSLEMVRRLIKKSKTRKIYMVEFISDAIEEKAKRELYLMNEDSEKAKFKNTQY